MIKSTFKSQITRLGSSPNGGVSVRAAYVANPQTTALTARTIPIFVRHDLYFSCDMRMPEKAFINIERKLKRLSAVAFRVLSAFFICIDKGDPVIT